MSFYRSGGGCGADGDGDGDGCVHVVLIINTYIHIYYVVMFGAMMCGV